MTPVIVRIIYFAEVLLSLIYSHALLRTGYPNFRRRRNTSISDSNFYPEIRWLIKRIGPSSKNCSFSNCDDAGSMQELTIFQASTRSRAKNRANDSDQSACTLAHTACTIFRYPQTWIDKTPACFFAAQVTYAFRSIPYTWRLFHVRAAFTLSQSQCSRSLASANSTHLDSKG